MIHPTGVPEIGTRPTGSPDTAESSRARHDQGGDPQWDIVVFIADAFRLDALSLCEPDRGLRSLAERFETWISFDRCVSAAPWTLPACASLLSGLSVGRHRHFHHGRRQWESLVPLLSVTHRTFGFVNNRALADGSGVPEDFDHFELVTDFDEPFLRARDVLTTTSTRPRFVLVHSNLAHDYYLPSSAAIHADYFGESSEWFALAGQVITWHGDVAQRVDSIRRTYQASAMRLSERFQELLDSVDMDRTIVVFIADHGEGLQPELGRVHHGGRMHEDLLHVPLAVHLPPSVPSEIRAALESAASTPVGTADVLPTVFGLLGVDLPQDIDGRDLTRAETTDHHHVHTAMDGRFLYTRNRFRINDNLRGMNMGRRDRLINRLIKSTVVREHLISAFVDWPFKLIVTDLRVAVPGLARVASRPIARFHVGDPIVWFGGTRWVGLELFDLESDPGECHNLLLDGADPSDVLAVADALVRGEEAAPLRSLIG